jgi:hypothetical protein
MLLLSTDSNFLHASHTFYAMIWNSETILACFVLFCCVINKTHAYSQCFYLYKKDGSMLRLCMAILTTHLHLVLRLRMHGAIPPLPHMFVWHGA